MTTLNRTRGPVKPAQGTVRWLSRPQLPAGIGRLAITSGKKTTECQYDFEALLDQNGRITGYRLVKDDDENYHLSVDLTRCSCPDHALRRAGTAHPACKHLAGLRVALAALEKNA